MSQFLIIGAIATSEQGRAYTIFFHVVDHLSRGSTNKYDLNEGMNSFCFFFIPPSLFSLLCLLLSFIEAHFIHPKKKKIKKKPSNLSMRKVFHIHTDRQDILHIFR